MENKLFFLFSFYALAFLGSCSSGNVEETSDQEEVHQDTVKGTYNPDVDTVYYYPSNANDKINDTTVSGFKIHTNIFPLEGKFVTMYKSGLSNDSKRIEDAKVLYREYGINIVIKDETGSQIINKKIFKEEFKSIIKDVENHFIRKVKFKGVENDKFRFDISFSHLAEDSPLDLWYFIKYYIDLDKKTYFEDYPKAHYDSIEKVLYPPDFEGD